VHPLWPPLLWSSSTAPANQRQFSFSRPPRTGLRSLRAYPCGVSEPGRETTMSDSRMQAIGTEQSSDFQDRSITCVDCGEPFIWTVGEQVFFHDKGLKNEPKRCKPCKHAKNDRLAAISAAQVSGVKQRIEVVVTCAQCGEQTTVPFYPSQGRPVYCRSCFLASRTMSATA
jgi:CxxC-x17-CxxC domain-containing protein